MNTSRIDQVLQFAVAVAGEEDSGNDRRLGPIHLIKYVYLADLEYAKTHSGQTFTGADWQFYKFGPWSQAVHGRIEPALLAIGAERHSFPSDYEDRDEWVRWELVDEHTVDVLDRALPISVTGPVRRYVHRFLTATPDLLSYVYSTEPMLAAAPCEQLDFTLVCRRPEPTDDEVDQPVVLTARQAKKLKAGMEEIRRQARERFAQKSRSRLVKPVLEPIYDEVYHDGLAWLDTLAGEALPEGSYKVTFSPDIWKSQARKGHDLS